MEGLLEIFPGFALGFLIVGAEQVGRVVGDHQRNIVPLMPLATKLRDSVLAAQERLCCRGTERADGFWFDGGSLAEEELAADLHFVGFGSSVLRRAAFHHVADVDIGSLERDTFFGGSAFDHLSEQLTSTPDERYALGIFIGTWTFTAKTSPCFGRAASAAGESPPDHAAATRRDPGRTAATRESAARS